MLTNALWSIRIYPELMDALCDLFDENIAEQDNNVVERARFSVCLGKEH